MIDRIAPSQRPHGRNAGTQTWASLLFAHWEVPAHTLRPCVPDALEIDTFDGRAFIGVVPFRMRAVRPRWLPKGLALHFLETNVRTYVVHQGRPGVYFFSLDASSRLAVLTARTAWSLPYHFAHMSADEGNGRGTYESRRVADSKRHRVAYRVGRELGTSKSGTLEHFLLERYLLFVERRQQILMGQVHHQPYYAFAAVIEEIEDHLIAAAGLPAMSRVPEFAHYSPGVDVEVFSLRRSLRP